MPRAKAAKAANAKTVKAKRAAWTCETCTFENESGPEFCEMCEMSRPGLYGNTEYFYCDICNEDCSALRWHLNDGADGVDICADCHPKPETKSFVAGAELVKIEQGGPRDGNKCDLAQGGSRKEHKQKSTPKERQREPKNKKRKRRATAATAAAAPALPSNGLSSRKRRVGPAAAVVSGNIGCSDSTWCDDDEAWLDSWIKRLDALDGIDKWPVLQPKGVRENLTAAWEKFEEEELLEYEEEMVKRRVGVDFHSPGIAQAMAEFFRACATRRQAQGSRPEAKKLERPHEAKQHRAEREGDEVAATEEKQKVSHEELRPVPMTEKDAELAEQAAVEEAIRRSVETAARGDTGDGDGGSVSAIQGNNGLVEAVSVAAESRVAEAGQTEDPWNRKERQRLLEEREQEEEEESEDSGASESDEDYAPETRPIRRQPRQERSITERRETTSADYGTSSSDVDEYEKAKEDDDLFEEDDKKRRRRMAAAKATATATTGQHSRAAEGQHTEVRRGSGSGSGGGSSGSSKRRSAAKGKVTALASPEAAETVPKLFQLRPPPAIADGSEAAQPSQALLKLRPTATKFFQAGLKDEAGGLHNSDEDRGIAASALEQTLYDKTITMGYDTTDVVVRYRAHVKKFAMSLRNVSAAGTLLRRLLVTGVLPPGAAMALSGDELCDLDLLQRLEAQYSSSVPEHQENAAEEEEEEQGDDEFADGLSDTALLEIPLSN